MSDDEKSAPRVVWSVPPSAEDLHEDIAAITEPDIIAQFRQTDMRRDPSKCLFLLPYHGEEE